MEVFISELNANSDIWWWMWLQLHSQWTDMRALILQELRAFFPQNVKLNL